MTGLLAVYGLKTLDYGYLARFYPVTRLQESCENRSLPLRFLFPRDVPAFLDPAEGRCPEEGNPLATASKPTECDIAPASIPSRDDFPPGQTVCLVRGRVCPGTIRRLETAGYRCVNSAEATETANDKLQTARLLDRLGIPTPKTALVDTLDADFRDAEYPLIAKPRHGSRGDRVRLVATSEEAHALADVSRLEDDEWLFQEYVASSRGRDLRVFFADDRVVAVVERNSGAGSLVSNASTGGAMSLARFGAGELEPWLEKTRVIAREVGLWYGTVDFLFRSAPDAHLRSSEDPLDLTICEVNAAPGFEALESATGFDVAGTLVDGLMRSFPH
jgi:RimK family alpha-L-glutamate ligase